MAYTYGDLLPAIKAARELNLPHILKEIVREYANALMIMAINRFITPEAMYLIEAWYEGSYLSTIYRDDLSSAALSRAMTACEKMNLNHASLNDTLKITGRSGSLDYDLTSCLFHFRNLEVLEYGYSQSGTSLGERIPCGVR